MALSALLKQTFELRSLYQAKRPAPTFLSWLCFYRVFPQHPIGSDQGPKFGATVARLGSVSWEQPFWHIQLPGRKIAWNVGLYKNLVSVLITQNHVIVFFSSYRFLSWWAPCGQEVRIFQLSVGVKESLVESQRMSSVVFISFHSLSGCIHFLSCSFHFAFIPFHVAFISFHVAFMSFLMFRSGG